MRIATWQWGGRRHAGLMSADGREVTPVALDPAEQPEGGLAIVRRLAADRPVKPSGARLPVSAITLEAPIPRPARNIFCVGKNYHAHAREFGLSGFDSSATSAADAVPEVPYIFTKVPESVIAPGAPIRIPSGVSEAIDYEVELAVGIGRGGTRIPRSSALDHVFGYTIVNDVTARDWQQRHKQWFLGKSFDTFCPMGPVIVSRDECDGQVNVRTFVNGEKRQDAHTRDLIFDVPALIECISQGITLQPGDVIATGTPVGVGIGFKPPKYLQRGDVVRLEIDGIGVLENPVQ
jgi:2-keto-4-pentenoate hydratase/2-oxohepta-3-ene-1,7-dioic acid hydratase in catechol pathway